MTFQQSSASPELSVRRGREAIEFYKSAMLKMQKIELDALERAAVEA